MDHDVQKWPDGPVPRDSQPHLYQSIVELPEESNFFEVRIIEDCEIQTCQLQGGDCVLKTETGFQYHQIYPRYRLIEMGFGSSPPM